MLTWALTKPSRSGDPAPFTHAPTPAVLTYATPGPPRPGLGVLAAMFFAGIAGTNLTLLLASLAFGDDWEESPIFNLGWCGVGLACFAIMLFVFGAERRLTGIRGAVRDGSIGRALAAGVGYALPVHLAGGAWDVSPVAQAMVTALLPTYALLFPVLVPLWVVRRGAAVGGAANADAPD